MRKPREEWKTKDDLAPQLAEFDLRCKGEDHETAARVLLDIDFNYLMLWGQYKTVIDMHRRLQGKLNDPYLRRTSSGNLGTAYYYVGEYQEAIKYYEQARDIARENNNKQGEGEWLGNLGSAYYSLGQVEKAIEYHEKALAIAKEIGDRRGEGGLLGNLGQTYSDLGQVEKAIEYSEKALVIKHEIGDSYGEATHLAILGHSLILQNKLEKAIREYDKAVSIAEETKNRQNQNEARYGQALSGVIALRMDETKAAKDAFISAIAKADEMLTKSKNNFSALYAKGLALSGLALCDGGKSRVDEAISAYKAACKINGYAGVIKRALLLFEELVKINEVGMLADVRDFLQSNQ